MPEECVECVFLIGEPEEKSRGFCSCEYSIRQIIEYKVLGIDDIDLIQGGVDDGAVADEVDSARDALRTAVNVAFCIVGEDGRGFSGFCDVVVDVGAGFLKTHALHVEEQTDALFKGQETGELEGCSELGLAAEDEGDSVL